MYGQDRNFRQEFPGDFMPPKEFKPGLIDFKDPLDIKDQHLVSLANNSGYLAGRVTELEKENYRLENENAKMREEVESFRKENLELKRRDDMASAGYKSGSQLVEEVEAAILKIPGIVDKRVAK